MKKKILVVDDEPLILKTIERALEKRGYAVHTVSDAESFMQALREVDPDLLIMDVNLGHRNSDSLVDEIQAARPGAKMLFISGGTPEMAPWNFLEKPFKIEELREKVRQILDEP